MSGAPVRRTSKGEAKPADPVAQVADNKEEDGAKGHAEVGSQISHRGSIPTPAAGSFSNAKDALTNASTLLRLLYFAAITYYTGLLVQRPILEKPERFASARLYHDMVAEMVLALCCVSFLHFGIILHDFVVATRPKIAAGYSWIAPMGLWVFTTAWMATYNMHIPFVYQRDWQWGLTAFFIILNLVVTCGLKLLVRPKALIDVTEHDRHV